MCLLQAKVASFSCDALSIMALAPDGQHTSKKGYFIFYRDDITVCRCSLNI